MSDFPSDPYAVFVLAAYVGTALILFLLWGWTFLNGRLHWKRLVFLESEHHKDKNFIQEQVKKREKKGEGNARST